MASMRERALCVVAGVCLFFGAIEVEAATATADENPSAPRMLVVTKGDLPTYAYPPTGAGVAKPLTIYLHGICGDPGHGCPYFREGATSASWLLCPSAPTECPGGGGTWSGTVAMQTRAVTNAEQQAENLFPNAIDDKSPRVLIGFSQGAYAARNLILAQPGRYRAVLFIGADISTTADAFRKAGITRVAFASGRYDMMRKPLEKEAASVKADGFPSRFVDLGAVGHTYVPASNAGELRDTIAWLEGG